MLLLSALVLTTDIWAIRKSLPTPYLTHTARRGKSKLATAVGTLLGYWPQWVLAGCTCKARAWPGTQNPGAVDSISCPSSSFLQEK